MNKTRPSSHTPSLSVFTEMGKLNPIIQEESQSGDPAKNRDSSDSDTSDILETQHTATGPLTCQACCKAKSHRSNLQRT